MTIKTNGPLEYNLAARLANWFAFGRLNLDSTLMHLDPDELMNLAGVEHCSGEWFKWFCMLLDDFPKQVVTPLGLMAARGIAYKALRNRRMIQQYFDRYPDVKDMQIKSPVFIAGFPRTGTTILQNLLASHEDVYAIPFWQMLNPVPHVDRPLALEDARRKAHAWLVMRANYAVAPEQRYIHEIRLHTYEEDWQLMAVSGVAMCFDWQFEMSKYGDAMMRVDMSWAYEELANMYRILLHQEMMRRGLREPPRLVVKCPDHLWFLAEIFKVFKDAHVIWTHRDPAKVIPSYGALTAVARRLMFGRAGKQGLGSYLVVRFRTGLEYGMECEKANPDWRRQLHHLRFADFIENTSSLDRDSRIYHAVRMARAASLPYGRDQMVGVLQAKRADKRGKNSYTPEDYVLNAADVRDEFAFYMNHYQIPEEHYRHE